MYKKIDFFEDEEIDAVLLNAQENIRYFTGIDFEGTVLITTCKKFIFTDSRYIEDVAKEVSEFSVIDCTTEGKYKAAKLKILNESFKRIGIDADSLFYSDYLKIFSDKLIVAVDVSKRLNEIRMIKEEFEIENMKTAQKISEDALKTVLPYIKEGELECNIVNEIEYKIKKFGAEKISFDTIVISGTRTSLPHGKPTHKKFKKGDFVTIDFGSVYKGYCSDMTRTFVIGKANKKQKKIYECVKNSQETAINCVTDGVLCKNVDETARSVMSKYEFEKYFRHSLGHGVGLLVHELPFVSSHSKMLLRKNMIVTIEPGVYIPDFGGVRIEDMILVTSSGFQNLNKFTKELIEIS
ncbi:MAG: Xaa-Pro peptidase family protein [Clostridiales bacterium]|jgi:Xaa-Pro aminopeptidase|nr:Xaa-Pro peptidase family protein [Clostridiales bacterium]